MNLKEHIRSIPDFPSKGILFYDISTLLRHPEAWRYTVDQMAERLSKYQPELIFGIESRGFLFAATVAYKLGCGVAMIRKKSKLPGDTISNTYNLEYGTDTLEVQADAIENGGTAVLIDDILATGGTILASIDLITKLGAEVKASMFLAELTFLGGRSKLAVECETLLSYDE
ncbi:MAG: adenine phosphoribosyltransferase [Rhodospirillaceae bacterium]